MAASCCYPKLECQVLYDASLNAWRWDGTAQWKLLFLSPAACRSFEGLLTNWRNFVNSSPISSPIYHSPQQGLHFQSRRAASFGNLGEFAPTARMSGGDAKFLQHINTKIRQEAGNTALTSDPKGLCTLVSEPIFERLMSMFELLRMRATNVQVLTEQGVAAICQKCSWAPNRAVGIAIFRYWQAKVHRRIAHGLQSPYTPSGFVDPSHEVGSFPPHALPVVGSGPSDMSAMTRLQEAPALQGRGNSEDSSARSSRYDSSYNHGSLRDSPLCPPSIFTLPEDPLLHKTAIYGSNTYLRPSWNPSLMMPHSGFEDQANQDWDPLDPQNLARIADPKSESIPSTPIGDVKVPAFHSHPSAEGSGFGPDTAVRSALAQSPSLLPSPKNVSMHTIPQDISSPFLANMHSLSTSDPRQSSNAAAERMMSGIDSPQDFLKSLPDQSI